METWGGMENRKWEEEYHVLLRESMTKGEIKAKGEGAEHREFPRFRLRSGAIWVKREQSFDVIDVSVSGIAFYSTHSFEPGQQCALTLGKAFVVEAEVKECHLVETDANFLETSYRVACRFADEHTGIRFLVMLKEMDDLGLTVPP